jgi:hypothetical protein
VIAGDAFDGILRIAESAKADLIVMGAHRKQLLRDILVGTTIERVIRIGPYPVGCARARDPARPGDRDSAGRCPSHPLRHTHDSGRTGYALHAVDRPIAPCSA